MKPLSIYIVLCLIAIILIAVSNWILITDDIYFDTFQEQLSFERINELIKLNKKWNWVIYPVTPVLYFLKCFLIVICLSSGAFLFRVEVRFKLLFKITLLAEFVFLLPVIIKLFWFTLIDTDFTLNDLQFFPPFSVINFFTLSDLQSWLIYPLSLVNLFEIAYILSLSYLLSKTVESSFAQSLKLVVLSYGTGLLIWVTFITFLTVSLSA